MHKLRNLDWCYPDEPSEIGPATQTAASGNRHVHRGGCSKWSNYARFSEAEGWSGLRGTAVDSGGCEDMTRTTHNSSGADSPYTDWLECSFLLQDLTQAGKTHPLTHIRKGPLRSVGTVRFKNCMSVVLRSPDEFSSKRTKPSTSYLNPPLCQITSLEVPLLPPQPCRSEEQAHAALEVPPCPTPDVVPCHVKSCRFVARFVISMCKQRLADNVMVCYVLSCCVIEWCAISCVCVMLWYGLSCRYVACHVM